MPQPITCCCCGNTTTNHYHHVCAPCHEAGISRQQWAPSRRFPKLNKDSGGHRQRFHNAARSKFDLL